MDYIDEKLMVLRAGLDRSGEAPLARRRASAVLLTNLIERVKHLGGGAVKHEDQYRLTLVPGVMISVGVSNRDFLLWFKIGGGTAVSPALEFDGEKWLGKDLDRDVVPGSGQRYQRKDAMDVVVDTLFELCRSDGLL